MKKCKIEITYMEVDGKVNKTAIDINVKFSIKESAERAIIDIHECGGFWLNGNRIIPYHRILSFDILEEVDIKGPSNSQSVQSVLEIKKEEVKETQIEIIKPLEEKVKVELTEVLDDSNSSSEITETTGIQSDASITENQENSEVPEAPENIDVVDGKGDSTKQVRFIRHRRPVH